MSICTRTVSYLWSDAEVDRHPETSRLAERRRRTAAGFVVRPGATVGVSATCEVLDASQGAAVRHLIVRYISEDEEYSEPTHVGYRIEPDGCG